jgi:hypothetical protein
LSNKEWWIVKTSDGFNNPKLPREPLVQAMNASQEGIKILEKVIEEKRR